jgi:hypothetical protein
MAAVSGSADHASIVGFKRERYHSPSMTKWEAVFLKRSTALCARRTSSNMASHSAGSRFDVLIIEARPLRSRGARPVPRARVADELRRERARQIVGAV